MYYTHFLNTRTVLPQSSGKIKLKLTGEFLSLIISLKNVMPVVAEVGIIKTSNKLLYVIPIVVGLKKGGNVTATVVCGKKLRPFRQEGYADTDINYNKTDMFDCMYSYVTSIHLTRQTESRKNLIHVTLRLHGTTNELVTANLTRQTESRKKLIYVTLVLHGTTHELVTSRLPAGTICRPSCLTICNDMTELDSLHKQGRRNTVADKKRAARRKINACCSIGQKKGSHYLIMVISTRANFAVIRAITLSKSPCTPMTVSYYMSRRNVTKRYRESRRIRKIYESYKKFRTRTKISESNYDHNYGNVVISTRDVFAVNLADKVRTSFHFPKLVRLTTRWRSIAIRSREHRQVKEKSCNMEMTCYKGMTMKGNYIYNYLNVEISTRAVSAVNKQNDLSDDCSVTTQSLQIYAIWTTWTSCPTQRSRDDNYILISPNSRGNKNLLTANFWKNDQKFDFLPNVNDDVFIKIWLYRTKGIVRQDHRNRINIKTNECTNLKLKSLFLLKLSVVQVMTARSKQSKYNVGVTYKANLDRSSPVKKCHRMKYIAGKKPKAMVTMVSIAKKASTRQQITIIIITLVNYTVSNNRDITLCDFCPRDMSEAETQRAVDHIPGVDGSDLHLFDDLVTTNMAATAQTTLVYDPVNDVYTHVQVEASQDKDIGEGRRDKVTSTGKEYNEKNNHVDTPGPAMQNKHVRVIDVDSQKTELGIITRHLYPTGTESLATQASDNTNDTTENHNEHEKTTNSTQDTTNLAPQPASSQPLPSSSEEGSDGDMSCEFSPASDSEQRQQPKPQHEQIDQRIKAQKDKFWKKLGKNDDPRIAALVPIHAPKMERLSRLQALKQRADRNPKAVKGDIVTGIMHEISKTADINYSIVPVNADFIMENELTGSNRTTIVTATNNPLSARPKPPKQKQSRQDKVLPFPLRRKGTLSPKTNLQKSLAADSDDASDDSWPTDQDDAIPTFRQRKKKTTKPAAKGKPKQVKKKGKEKAAKQPKVAKPKKPKKLTKTAITAMVYKIRQPIQMSNWDPNLKLETARTRKLVKDQKIRMRQRECRAKKKLEKEKQIKGPEQDVLAQVINFSNILEESDTSDAELVHFLENLEQQQEPLSPCSTENEPLEEEIDTHLDNLADQHIQEEDSDDTESSDDEWRTGMNILRNPFAKTEDRPVQPVAHQGYFTEQGLKKQQQQTEALKRSAGLDPSSVLIVSLDRSEVSDYLKAEEHERNTNQQLIQQQQQLRTNSDEPSVHRHLEPEETMSAKNISKDRSTSRGRTGNQNRFDKGREGQSDPEDMEHDQQENAEQNNTGSSSNTKGKGKRQRDPPRTGAHDNTTTEDSDDELPGAKRNMTSLREKLTNVYQKKTKETREKRDENRTTPSVAFRVDKSHAGEKVKSTTVPLLEPVKLVDAPTLSLKDLVPESDKYGIESQGQDESFKSDRIEFVVVEREIDEDEQVAMGSDRDYEWEIPSRESSDAIMGQAIDKYTEEDWDRIDFLTFSSVGWNTGVGLFAFGSDKLDQMNIFRDIIRTLRIGNRCFESYPKRMLLNRYALTIYFNAAFQWNSELKLLFFIKKLNGFSGELTMVETRFYPEDHPTRKGCKIVACEADQLFLDELYKYPKDHAFSIRFGRNLYIRGGERIDPDDPDAVRQRRPKLTRNAAKKFIQGSGEDILNNGQRVDDEEAKKARAEHMRKYVRGIELFTNSMRYFNSKAKGIFFKATWGATAGKKLRTIILFYTRASKHTRCAIFYMMVGNNKVEPKDAHIFARKMEKNRDNRSNLMMSKLYNDNDPCRGNDPSNYMNEVLTKKNIKRCKLENSVYACIDTFLRAVISGWNVKKGMDDKELSRVNYWLIRSSSNKTGVVNYDWWDNNINFIHGVRHMKFIKDDKVLMECGGNVFKYGLEVGTFFLLYIPQKVSHSLLNESEQSKQTSGKIHNFLNEKRGRSLKIPADYIWGTLSRKMCKLYKQTMKVSKCEKGKQICGNIYNLQKLERGRSLKIATFGICVTPSRIMYKLFIRIITTGETNGGIRGCIMTYYKSKALSITGCNGET